MKILVMAGILFVLCVLTLCDYLFDSKHKYKEIISTIMTLVTTAISIACADISVKGARDPPESKKPLSTPDVRTIHIHINLDTKQNKKKLHVQRVRKRRRLKLKKRRSQHSHTRTNS